MTLPVPPHTRYDSAFSCTSKIMLGACAHAKARARGSVFVIHRDEAFAKRCSSAGSAGLG